MLRQTQNLGISVLLNATIIPPKTFADTSGNTADVELIDIPCEYQVLRQNGAMEWLPSSSSDLSDEPGFQTMVDFELCYPRNPPLPCSPVQNYAEASGYYSPDALPLALFDDHRPTNQYGA